MFCKFCGFNIDDKTVFCSNCGNRLSEESTIEKVKPLSATKINRSSANLIETKSTIQKTAAKEIMINLKLALIALIIGVISYPVQHEIKEPYYVPQDVLEKNLKILDEHQMKGSGFYQLGWAGDSEYDRNITVGAIRNINVIRKNAFLDDIKYKSRITFIIMLLVFIIGRYLLKGLDWVNKTAKTE